MLVRRANVTLDVPDGAVENYFNKGYSVIDKNGKVLREAVPTDLGTLRLAYVKNKKIIEDKDKQIVDLQNEVNLLSQQLATAKKKLKQQDK